METAQEENIAKIQIKAIELLEFNLKRCTVPLDTLTAFTYNVKVEDKFSIDKSIVYV